MTPQTHTTTPPAPADTTTPGGEYASLALVTAGELCKAFSIGETALRRWRREGVPCVHIGKKCEKGARGLRFNLLDVRRWLDAREKTHQATKTTPAP